MQVLALAALSAYRAKRDAKDAHKVFVAAAKEYGVCQAADHNLPCYSIVAEREDWCEVCTARQPYHERKLAAARKSGVAMRRLWQLCKKASGD